VGAEKGEDKVDEDEQELVRRGPVHGEICLFDQWKERIQAVGVADDVAERRQVDYRLPGELRAADLAHDLVSAM
jgi:hypothetical protein